MTALKQSVDGTYRVGTRERSNECLGASVGVGARHEQCPGYWGRSRVLFRVECGCSCHLASLKVKA